MIIGDQRFSVELRFSYEGDVLFWREGCLCADVLAKPYQDGYYKDFT